jgi:hypothetical protein
MPLISLWKNKILKIHKHKWRNYGFIQYVFANCSALTFSGLVGQWKMKGALGRWIIFVFGFIVYICKRHLSLEKCMNDPAMLVSVVYVIKFVVYQYFKSWFYISCKVWRRYSDFVSLQSGLQVSLQIGRQVSFQVALGAAKVADIEPTNGLQGRTEVAYMWAFKVADMWASRVAYWWASKVAYIWVSKVEYK